jgi:rare lipoprotein A
MKGEKKYFLIVFKKLLLLPLLFCFYFSDPQQIPADSLKVSDTALIKSEATIDSSEKVLYGIASFYGNKFEGRKTANGEIFSQKKFTAACNLLPLGTWIKVTNLKNGRSVIVKTNDRLHPKMKRLVDLTKAAAVKLNYVGGGVTRVKVEIIKKPKSKKKK